MAKTETKKKKQKSLKGILVEMKKAFSKIPRRPAKLGVRYKDVPRRFS